MFELKRLYATLCSGRCELLAIEKSRGKAGETLPSAIDEVTGIRALQIYPEHNQTRAIRFINYVVEKFPFRIGIIRTDRGHEFQACFHWRNVYCVQWMEKMVNS